MRSSVMEMLFSIAVCLSCGAAVGYFGAAFLHSISGWSP